MVNQEHNPVNETELPLFEHSLPEVDWSNIKDDDIMPQQSGIEIPITFEHAPLDDEWPIFTDDKTEIPFEQIPLDVDWENFKDDATEVQSTFEQIPLDADWENFKDDATEVQSTFEQLPLDVDWENLKDDATEVQSTFEQESLVNYWSSFRDDDIVQQQSAIRAVEAEKIPFVGDKEPISSLEAEYQSGSPILLEKIKVLSEQFDAIRRVRGDGNCFFRAFMFSYLEHIFVSQDREEVDRIKAKIEQCRDTLQNLGYPDLTFEDFFELFLEQLNGVIQGNDVSISFDDLVERCRNQSVSDYIVMFFRFITSGEIRKRLEFFEPFVVGLSNGSVEQFCKSSVELMGEESDHVHITALSDTLGVAIRVEYLDQSVGIEKYGGGITINHHDFIPTNNDNNDGGPAPEDGDSFNKKPFIALLYRPGHYDVLYYSNSEEEK